MALTDCPLNVPKRMEVTKRNCGCFMIFKFNTWDVCFVTRALASRKNYIFLLASNMGALPSKGFPLLPNVLASIPFARRMAESPNRFLKTSIA